MRIATAHLAICVAALLVWSTEAQAYLDPGTGSLLFQALAAAFLGGAMTFRIWWGRLKDGVAALLGRQDPADTPDE